MRQQHRQRALPLMGRVFIAGLFLLSAFQNCPRERPSLHPVGGPSFCNAALWPLAVLVEIGGSVALIAGYRTRLSR